MLMPSERYWGRSLFNRWGWVARRRGRSRRRMTHWGHLQGPTAALVETLEARVLLSSIVVNSTSDSASPPYGTMTLRAAINTAGGNTITFDPTVFKPATLTTITLTKGPLELTHDVTITGPGAAQVAVSGGNLTTVFAVERNVTAEIDGLMITKGKGSSTISSFSNASGGGIFNAGTLALKEDSIRANSANVGGGIANDTFGTLTISNSTIAHNPNTAANRFPLGGGLFNFGIVTVTNSTIANNRADSGGGFFNQGDVTVTNSTIANNGADFGGAIFQEFGAATITNSTIANNSAGNTGGGIFQHQSDLTVTNSTIANNSAFGAGGGIYGEFGGVTATNSIIANNDHGDWLGTAANNTSSNNLIGVGGDSRLTNGVNGNIVGTTASPVNPLLGPLANHGGPTQTMALLPGSPAIDKGGITTLQFDQRGAPFARVAGAAVDIGAFEDQLRHHSHQHEDRPNRNH